MGVQDPWAAWLLERRHGGDESVRQSVVQGLLPVRDRLLLLARIKEGETVLDVGTGDGLIAFGALNQVGESGRVIFSDISAVLLSVCRERVHDLGRGANAAFVETDASSLAGIEEQSVDVVTIRSVLIYVEAKLAALQACHRVLRPGGRLALFEPVGSLSYLDPPGTLWGYDLSAEPELLARVRGVYDRAQPPDRDPLYNWTERDLLHWPQKAGFAEVSMDLSVKVGKQEPRVWESFFHAAGNPKLPSLSEAIECLTSAEADRFIKLLRPLVESGEGVRRSATIYLSATKADSTSF